MIYSMTGYASATRELVAASGTGGVSVSVELRTVNSRFLDLNFRMPEDVRVCEPTLREMLMNKLSRGKVDIRINLQRSEQTANAGSINHDALTQLALLERTVLATFPEAGRLRSGEILRWPGVLAETGVAPDVPEGNVVVLYSGAGSRAPLEALAEEIAGPPSAELEEAGQAVVVREAQAAQGIVAIAGERGVRVTDPADPRLRAFIEAHLGAAAG